MNGLNENIYVEIIDRFCGYKKPFSLWKDYFLDCIQQATNPKKYDKITNFMISFENIRREEKNDNYELHQERGFNNNQFLVYYIGSEKGITYQGINLKLCEICYEDLSKLHFTIVVPNNFFITQNVIKLRKKIKANNIFERVKQLCGAQDSIQITDISDNKYSSYIELVPFTKQNMLNKGLDFSQFKEQYCLSLQKNHQFFNYFFSIQVQGWKYYIANGQFLIDYKIENKNKQVYLVFGDQDYSDYMKNFEQFLITKQDLNYLLIQLERSNRVYIVFGNQQNQYPHKYSREYIHSYPKPIASEVEQQVEIIEQENIDIILQYTQIVNNEWIANIPEEEQDDIQYFKKLEKLKGYMLKNDNRILIRKNDPYSCTQLKFDIDEKF